jgi:hypothetical protein
MTDSPQPPTDSLEALAALPGLAGIIARRLARSSETPATPGVFYLRMLLACATYLVAADLGPVIAGWI